MKNESRIASWAEYPRNLENADSDNNDYDYHEYHDQLKLDSERIFISGNRLSIRVVEEGRREIDFSELGEFERYLQESQNCDVIRVFLIPQQSSWGQLVISYEGACKLFSYLGVHPVFIDIVRAFGSRTGSENESYATIHEVHNNDDDSEVCYLIKHAEENGREGAPSPWSMRQMGVWHQHCVGSSDSFVVINPSKSLQLRLRRLSQPGVEKGSAAIHQMIISSAMTRWRWYIEFMERSYASMKIKAQLSNILDGEARFSPWTEIHFDDTQDIQVLQDQFLQTQHHLKTNCIVMEGLRKSLDFTDNKRGSRRRPLLSHMKEAEMQALRVKSILQRVDATLALVRAILDFRSMASLQSSSKSMAVLTELGRADNELMVDLSQKAAKDTDVLKTVTLLGLVYLPAAFVASMMSMGYINVVTEPRFGLSFSGEFWIFLVLTAIFLFVTLGSYFLWMRTIARSARINNGRPIGGIKRSYSMGMNGYQYIEH